MQDVLKFMEILPDLEVPTIFVHPDIYDNLDDFNRPKHLWEALEFIGTEGGRKWIDDTTFRDHTKLADKLAHVISVTRTDAAEICTRFVRKFEFEDRWEDRNFSYWPHNYCKDDEMHLCDMGALPPRILWLPA